MTSTTGGFSFSLRRTVAYATVGLLLALVIALPLVARAFNFGAPQPTVLQSHGGGINSGHFTFEAVLPSWMDNAVITFSITGPTPTPFPTPTPVPPPPGGGGGGGGFVLPPASPEPTPTPAPEPTTTPTPTPSPTPVSTPTPTPFAPSDGPVFEVLTLVTANAETRVQTSLVELIIPPSTFLNPGIEVRIRSLPADALPQPPSGMVFIRGIQLNTLAGGSESSVAFLQPVTLRVPLTGDDLEMAGREPTALRVLRFDAETVVWHVLETELVAGPPPYLEATLHGFSFFAVAAPQQQTAPSPPPSPVPSSTPTAAPMAMPTPVVQPTGPPDPSPGAGTLSLVIIPVLLVLSVAVAAALWALRRSRR